MNEQSGFFRKAANALAGKGFYMVLLVCLVILGASGFFLYRTVADLSFDTPTAAQTQVTLPTQSITPVLDPVEDAVSPVKEEVTEVIPTVETDVDEPVPAINEEPLPAVSEVSTPVAEVTQPAKPVFGWPVDGEVIGAFSNTELTYSPVMGDWRTHNGVDLACDLGTQVRAAAAGTVVAVGADPLTGTTLTLEHENSLVTVYGNLDADTLTVALGDSVEAGAILGCVSSGNELAQPCLHFSILKDGKAVNPTDFIG